MNQHTVLVFLLLQSLCILFVRASVKIVDIETNNHDYVLNGRSPTLVLFHTSWCGHCKHFMPQFEEVAEYVSKPVQLARIDCDEEYELCLKHGVTAYPMLKYFAVSRNVVPEEYVCLFCVVLDEHHLTLF